MTAWTDFPTEPPAPGRYVCTLYLSDEWAIVEWDGAWRRNGIIQPVTAFFGPIPEPLTAE